MNNVRDFLVGKKATWLLFGMFGFTILVKIIAFHWFVFHSVIISSLWEAPLVFWMFWLPKLCTSAFLAFFILISKRKWWTLFVLIVIDIWIIANLIYFRANNFILTWDAIMMAGNLAGFESSICFYWNWQCWLFLLITLVYGVFLRFIKITSVGWRGILLSGIFIIVSYFGGNYAISERYQLEHSVKNYTPLKTPNVFVFNESGFYIEQHSVVAYFFYVIVNGVIDTFLTESVVLSEDEEVEIVRRISPPPQE